MNRRRGVEAHKKNGTVKTKRPETSRQNDAMEKIEKDFFHMLSSFDRVYTLLTRRIDIEMCKLWMKKLLGIRHQTMIEKVYRNIYMSRLILVMSEGRLTGIFSRPPPVYLSPPSEVFPVPIEPEEVELNEEYQKLMNEQDSKCAKRENSLRPTTTNAETNGVNSESVKQIMIPERESDENFFPDLTWIKEMIDRKPLPEDMLELTEMYPLRIVKKFIHLLSQEKKRLAIDEYRRYYTLKLAFQGDCAKSINRSMKKFVETKECLNKALGIVREIAKVKAPNIQKPMKSLALNATPKTLAICHQRLEIVRKDAEMLSMKEKRLKETIFKLLHESKCFQLKQNEEARGLCELVNKMMDNVDEQVDIIGILRRMLHGSRAPMAPE